ncbi:MAG TPA: DUF4349 domain-containing protein [Solirubrobacterales bacterium]|jgi:hypothetical protein|nr:DUF4349 domain-containing protein [Solirubrobacterales bacterium]
MEPFRDDDDLIAELGALRPTPRPAFAAELDERVAAGFPRRSWLTGTPLGPRFARLWSLPPRRLILSGGAATLAAIAVATVVVAVSEPEAGHYVATQSSQEAKPRGGEESSGIQFDAPVPTVTGHVGSSRGDSSASAAAGIGSTGSSTTGTGPFASRAGHREVERSAEMVLGAEPTEVADDAAKVFDAVHAADGIVLSSSVSGGAAGDAGARFDLLIPSAKLSDALADFSAIDAVVSRREATDDITAPTVRLGEHLRDSRAKIDGLLVQLAGANSDGERAEVEAELSAERRHAASLRSRLTKLDRRANLSRVSLRIETGAAAASSHEGSDWGIGDALGDAGHILAIAAGVTIVGLAVVGPLALIALLAWLANRTRLRRARERTLA